MAKSAKRKAGTVSSAKTNRKSPRYSNITTPNTTPKTTHPPTHDFFTKSFYQNPSNFVPLCLQGTKSPHPRGTGESPLLKVANVEEAEEGVDVADLRRRLDEAERDLQNTIIAAETAEGLHTQVQKGGPLPDPLPGPYPTSYPPTYPTPYPSITRPYPPLTRPLPGPLPASYPTLTRPLTRLLPDPYPTPYPAPYPA